MDFIFQLIRKTVENVLNVFNWIRHKIVRPIGEWHQEHLLASKLSTIGIFLAILLFIFIDARVIAPMHSRYASTPLNEAQTLGENGQTQMAITSRKYNAKQHFMIVKMHASSSDSQPLDPSNVKFKVRAFGHKKIPVEKIALLNNDYVLVLSDLQPGYRAIQIKVTNTQVTTNNSVTTDTDDVDDSSLDDSSSKDKKASADGAGSNYYNFIINEDKKFISNSLQKKTKSQYLIQDLQDQITKLKKQITANNEDIDAGMKQTKADQNAIDDINNQSKYSVNKDSNADKVKQLQTDYQSQQDQITALTKRNEKKQEQILLYKKQINDIKNGKYKFDDE